ncbi:MAG: hypothetical protein RJA09_2652 [Pseudomonadota bacterium]|jgi:hypothetical protein
MPKMIVSIDGVVIREFELTKERTTMGRRPYNDIVIDNLAVSGEHAVFLCKGEEVRIDDLNSTNGTYVNGRAVKSERLKHNDLIEIGRYKIKVQLPQAAPATPAFSASRLGPFPEAGGSEGAPTARIRVLTGPAADRELPLTKVVTTLGKPGVTVAAVTQRGPGHVLSMVEGALPPAINGMEVGADPVLLRHDDVIELAGTQMRYLVR